MRAEPAANGEPDSLVETGTPLGDTRFATGSKP